MLRPVRLSGGLHATPLAVFTVWPVLQHLNRLQNEDLKGIMGVQGTGEGGGTFGVAQVALGVSTEAEDLSREGCEEGSW